MGDRELITTADLRVELGGVSRNWVYDHIDPLFPRPRQRGVSVKWPRKDVYAALAEAAVVSVSQEWHDFEQDIRIPFMDENEMMYLMSARDIVEAAARRNPMLLADDGGRLELARREDARFMSHFDEAAVALWGSRIDFHSRKRGGFVEVTTPEWVADAIRSGHVGVRVKDMPPSNGTVRLSTEMRYRRIWDLNMPRIEVFGVTWYMDLPSPEDGEFDQRPLARLVPVRSALEYRARKAENRRS